ncbi:MAG: helix-turn-helix domain-containing protein [Parvibaculaceae bacterium]|nr:helix-turn-helix domain-containing protein [Parvibaculaceae bacterium]
MRWEDLDQQPCSLARTLSVIGDRWTLLILRDCFLKVRRFESFELRLGIARHILADRLKKLVEAGVLDKVLYQERPRREEYRLTRKGLDLYPVLLAMLEWGDAYMADPEGPAVIRRHKKCGAVLASRPVCTSCGEAVTAHDVSVEAGPGAGDADIYLHAATAVRSSSA